MKNISLLVLTLTTLIGCNVISKKKVNKELQAIYPLEQCSEVSDFGQYISGVEIIPLETAQECFITDVKKCIVTSQKQFIILSSSNIFLFDSTGDFRFQIGRVGKGPGEFVRITDICLGSGEDNILALDCYNDVLVYSLANGHFIRRITPEWEEKVSSFDGICTAGDSGFFLFSSNPPVVEDFQTEFFCLGEFDKTGKLRTESFSRKDFCFSSDRFTKSFSNEVFIRPLEGDDILYRSDDGKFNPYLKIDFGEETIPLRYIFDSQDNAWSNIPGFVKSPYYKLPMGFFDTEKQLYFWCGGPGGKTYEFLYFNNLTSGIQWNNNDKLPFTFVGSDSSGFYAVYDNVDGIEPEKNYKESSLKNYIREKYDLRRETLESNPIIVRIIFNEVI